MCPLFNKLYQTPKYRTVTSSRLEKISSNLIFQQYTWNHYVEYLLGQKIVMKYISIYIFYEKSYFSYILIKQESKIQSF